MPKVVFNQPQIVAKPVRTKKALNYTKKYLFSDAGVGKRQKSMDLFVKRVERNTALGLGDQCD